MDTWMIIVVIAAVGLVAALAFAAYRRQHTQGLARRFGPEYESVVEQEGGRRPAERVLDLRVERREELDIRPLSVTERARFVELWEGVQARFVDDPGGAIADADQLVAEVMETRGYPVDGFDERADLVSVDHADVASDYRRGHTLFQRHQDGRADTEDLRAATLAYRSLFERLVSDSDNVGTQARTEEPRR